ncbi:MAG TPA: signal peptidase I [Candidatus Paceibacterota bacterium]
MKRFFVALWEVSEILIVALASIFIIYNFIAQPFLVQGASMEPNFQSGNYLLVDELSYRFRDPIRGEVIVFINPNNESEFYIKRIIGLPTEKIDIINSQVFVDGDKIDEYYLPLGADFKGDYSFILDSDEYFVMGDNRSQSFDSRNWGPLAKDKIVGAVRLRFWPINKFQIFIDDYATQENN